MKGVIAHHVLAGLSIVALVIINIWGKESEMLTTALIGVISAALWGGVQRQQGIDAVKKDPIKFFDNGSK